MHFQNKDLKIVFFLWNYISQGDLFKYGYHKHQQVQLEIFKSLQILKQ